MYWCNVSPSDFITSLSAPEGYSFLYTDALQDFVGVSLVQDGAFTDHTAVFPEALQDAHIGVKELYAILFGLQFFATELASTKIVLFCDN